MGWRAPLFVLAAIAALAAAMPASQAAERGRPSCFGEPATIVSDRFYIKGTPGDDVIVHRRGGLIESKAGDDLICPRGDWAEVYSDQGSDRIGPTPGEDFVYPGPGADRARTGGGPDLLTDTDRSDDSYSAGAGRDLVRFSTPFSRLQRAVEVDLARGLARGHGRDRLQGIESVEGTARPESISGDGGANRLDAIRGGDRIRGAGGDDVIRGAARKSAKNGGDPYSGSDPVLAGGPGDDRIFGNAGRDGLFGGPGDDSLDGGSPGAAPGDRGEGGPGADFCRDLESSRGCESGP